MDGWVEKVVSFKMFQGMGCGMGLVAPH